MKRLVTPAVLLVVSGCVSGCASGGGAPAPAARRVLVEVRGSRTEADTFASRFLYEAEERGTSLVDARLSGAHVADLADPASEVAKKLHEAFPGDVYLGVEVSPCETASRRTVMPGSIDPTTGIRTNDVIGGVDVACTVALTEMGADGKVRRSVTVEGRVTVTSMHGAEEPNLEAMRDAAAAAAKKLYGKKKL